MMERGGVAFLILEKMFEMLFFFLWAKLGNFEDRFKKRHFDELG